MQYEHYFPLGIAYDEAFLGRQNEITLLKRNAQAVRHTLLLSPRKYGKSSLVKNVIKELDYPAADIDLFLLSNAKSIEAKILKGARTLINNIAPSPEKWINTLANYFKKMDKRWTIGLKGVHLELIPDPHNDSAENIRDALSAVEYVLMKNKKKAIFFIDEVQEITHIEGSRAIEGAIRNFSQEAKHLMLIFSGSSQHMLRHMFEDQTRPLYDLCETIHLDRLAQSEYSQYLNQIAKKTWKQPLSHETFETIMHISECHPKVVYILCKKLWDHCTNKNKVPSPKDVKLVWSQYIQSYLKDTRNTLSARSVGQIKVLTYIATGNTSSLMSKAAQGCLNLTSGAIMQALAVLEQNDFIERLPNHIYRVIDPTVKATLDLFNKDYIYTSEAC